MKASKIIFAIFIFFLFSIHSHAQFSLGLKGGATKAWQNYGEVELPEDAVTHVWGYNISLMTYYKLGNHIELGMEPGYIKRGAACIPGWNIGSQPVFEGDTKFLLDYVEIPLFVYGKVPVYKDRIRFMAKAGYGISFMIKAIREEMIIDSDSPPNRFEMATRQSSLLNWIDHGFYFGSGFELKIKNHYVFLESDFYLSPVDTEKFNTSQNRNISFCIGVKKEI